METRIAGEQNSTFGYINERSGLFEPVNLVQHLKNLGVWEEPTTDKRGLSPELANYYDKLRATIAKIK